MKTVLAGLLNTLLLLASTSGLCGNNEVLFERKLEAAVQGDTEAAYDVAYRYEKGRGTEEDEELALEWYSRAAEQGLAKAQSRACRRRNATFSTVLAKNLVNVILIVDR